MNKKYELLRNDYIEYEGRTLYRIKALRDFGNVKAGELGGYIEKEDNLSHEHNCWVYKHAKVFGNAKVYDNAYVSGNAKVSGVVFVYGNAEVFGSAIVFDNAHISGNVVVFGNAKIFGYAHIFGNAEVFGSAIVYDNAEVYDNAYVYGNAEVYQNAKITCNSRVYGDAKIEEDTIIGKVSIPYKKIFQYQCAKRLLTAILTEDDKILYSLGCQENITEEEFIDRIHNTFGGLYYNPHRQEYLDIIKLLNIYL